MSLTFHETFSLDLANLSRLLDAALDDPKTSNEDIQLATGMGNKKVEPTIRYAAYCNLLRRAPGTRELEVTDVGKVVLEGDRHLVSPVTHWVLNYHLSNPETGAEAWSFFIYKFLPRNNEFTKTKLRTDLETISPALNRSSMNKNIAPLLKSYLSSDGLNKLKFFTERGPETYSRETSTFPNIFTAAYIFAEIWDQHYADKFEIRHDDLFGDGYLGAALNLDAEQVQRCLNEMSAESLVEQMREAPPHKVVPKWNDKFALLRRAYKEA